MDDAPTTTPVEDAPAPERRRRPSLARLAAVVVPAVAIVVVVSFALGATGAPEDPYQLGLRLTPPGDRVAAPADEAQLLGGGTTSLGEHVGHVVVLNFWASWCGPCRAEQPELNEAYERLAGEPVTFLGVALQDTEVNASAHWREFAVPYDSIFDPANVYAARFGGVGPAAIPTTIFIDTEGRVAGRLFGRASTDAVVTAVRDLLAERG